MWQGATEGCVIGRQNAVYGRNLLIGELPDGRMVMLSVGRRGEDAIAKSDAVGEMARSIRSVWDMQQVSE